MKSDIIKEKENDKNTEKEAEGLTIEETFARLDETISQLEGGDIPLEEALEAYEQGMKYIKSCNDAIDRVEKKVMIIRENGELDEF